MNYRMISKILGRVMAVEATLMVLPTLTALYYGESVLPFVCTMLIAAALFGLLTLILELCLAGHSSGKRRR